MKLTLKQTEIERAAVDWIERVLSDCCALSDFAAVHTRAEAFHALAKQYAVPVEAVVQWIPQQRRDDLTVPKLRAYCQAFQEARIKAELESQAKTAFEYPD